MENIIKLFLEFFNYINSWSLNSIWNNLGITDFSFIRVLQIITELLNQFETLDGITKLGFILIWNNSFILWCLFSIILNKYADNLMDKFNLEARFPKLAILIRYRKKLTKFYLVSNYVLIILVCLTNIIFGISILYLYFTTRF